MNSPKKPFKLITIPVSHYCEKARWALDLLNFAYVEEAHMPPFHRLATKRVGGKSTPVLVTETETLTDSTDILRYLDAIAPPNFKLYPTDSNQLQQVKELENLFNSQLGTAVRTWAYSYTLNDYKRIQKKWTQGVPFYEQIFFPLVFPMMKNVVVRAYNVNSESAANARAQIQRIFDRVGDLLADGRKYLVGEFSAADLTFAALAAPIILPKEHPTKPGNLDELPPEMAAEIEKFRATTAGAYVLQLYRHRNKISS
jgi:glutathione S-transferase